MKRKIIFILCIFLTIFVFLSFFMGLDKDNVYKPIKIIDNKIVNFKGDDLYSNKILDLNNIVDTKFILINIWASWCSPCRSEHKYILQLKKNQQLSIIGLNYKDKVHNAKNFILELGNPYDFIIKDKFGTISIELGAYGVPETYIVNTETKKVIYKYIGPIDKEIKSEIEKIIRS